MRIIILLLCFFIASCNAQHSVLTNEIFIADDKQKGVKSKNGKILIDPEFKDIHLIFSDQRMTYESIKNSERRPLDFYLVTRQDKQKGIFNSNGKKVFDFRKCSELQIDERTKTIVVINKSPENNKNIYSLFDFNNKQLDTDQFQKIGYIENTDLIILAKQKRKEVYLYNSKTKLKHGPYDHFVVWDETHDPTLGIKSVKFKRLEKAMGIGVRFKNTWGMIDMEGKEILPIEYSYIKLFTEEQKNHPYFRYVTIPDDLRLVLMSRSKDKKQTFYYDINRIKYELIEENPDDPTNKNKVMVKVK